ncbi:MAG: hypothetical protein LBK99_23845 [Opitutaceae bacterium]|jgi:hypothetical protein|nr:hypothetical protein [Opitutaceae bacterium]
MKIKETEALFRRWSALPFGHREMAFVKTYGALQGRLGVNRATSIYEFFQELDVNVTAAERIQRANTGGEK